MKKSLLLLSIPALLMAASCSTDETVDAPDLQEKAITFTTNLENSSRSMGGNPEWFTPENFKTFYAFAFSNDPGHDTDNFFDDAIFGRNANGSWIPDGENRYYFPEWRLKFVAYAPANQYELGGVTSIGQGTRNYFGIDFTPQKQRIFGLNLSFYGDIDLIVAANGKRNLRNDPKVKMTFKHTLSKVTIKVKQRNPALRFIVASAGIGHAHDGGTFTYPDCTDKEEIELTQDCWSFPNEDNYGDFSAVCNLTVNGNGQDATVGDFLIFPQNSINSGFWTGGPEEDGTYLYVRCNIYQKSGKDSYDTELFSKGSIAIPLKFDFQPGYHYTFTIDMTNGGLIAPSNTSVVKDGGTPVLGGEIQYSAISSHWEVADTDLKM